MTTFGWKRKTGANVSRSVSAAFESQSKSDDDNDLEKEGIDWLSLMPKKKYVCIEDAIAKSSRLKQEGTVLAESERYWEAIKKWDEAIQLTPSDATLYEMKAQALLILCEVYPALHMAEKVVEKDPTWWVGYQTQGRAQLGLGEVKMALKSFSKAVHINPADRELWDEDFNWTVTLLSKKVKSEQELKSAVEKNELQILEIEENAEIKEGSVELYTQNSEQELKSKKVLQDSEKTNSKSEDQLNLRLPRNYILMRDAT